MAAYKTIMAQVRAALDTAMRAVTLGVEVREKFRMRSESERDKGTSIAADAGNRPRIWQLTEPLTSERITIGYASSRRWKFTFDIEIVYPQNETTWRLAPWDDADRIMQYLQDHSLGVAGVEIFEPDTGRAIETETIEGNGWLVVRIPVFAHFEISI